jgi:hypothetical protein
MNDQLLSEAAKAGNLGAIDSILQKGLAERLYTPDEAHRRRLANSAIAQGAQLNRAMVGEALNLSPHMWGQSLQTGGQVQPSSQATVGLALGSTQGAPSSTVAGEPAPSPSSSGLLEAYIPHAFNAPTTTGQSTINLQVGQGTVSIPVDPVQQAIRKYLQTEMAQARQEGKLVNPVDLFNAMKVGNSPAVAAQVSILQKANFDATYSQAVERGMPPLLATHLAFRSSGYFPEGERGRYLAPNLEELSKAQITSALASPIQGLVRNVADLQVDPHTLVGRFDPQENALNIAQTSNLPLDAAQIREVLRGFEGSTQQVFLALQRRGISPPEAAVLTAQILPNIPLAPSIQRMLDPATTFGEAAARTLLPWATPQQVGRAAHEFEAQAAVAHSPESGMTLEAVKKQGQAPDYLDLAGKLAQTKAEAERRAAITIPERVSTEERGQAQRRANQIEVGRSLLQQAQEHPDWFGGAAGWRGKKRAFQAWMDTAPPGFTDFNNDVKRLRAELINALAGANIGPAEYDIYLSVFPDVTSNSSQQFISNTKKTLQNIQRLDAIAARIQVREGLLTPLPSEAERQFLPENPTMLKRLKQGAGMIP